ncbi:hypothetical protein PSTT_02183 [Puccinia striiformis]|uniref:DDE Tnp4 domain-containing protein n=1 Tax=Puccinia striiformis TaxID=27350 RepID=A0A2S4W0M2_9BASI|nr:hypothetical protein PSTT_02183 [Puccinia striiformis]
MLRPYRLDPKQLQLIQIPQASYVRQDIDSWLEWFLSRSDTESDIGDWAKKIRQSGDQSFYNLHQSPCWKTFTSSHAKSNAHELHLVFSLFVDWFNPFGNKTAGKKHSMGIVAMNCLNTPPTSRSKLSNWFLAAITPGPHEPDVVTINHILKPIVEDLLRLKDGIFVKTHQYPNKRKVFLYILPLVGDMPANHKVAGFTSHAGTKFCTWCDVTLDSLSKLKLSTPRTKESHLEQAKNWKEADTLGTKNTLRKKSGVRWSELNLLPYRDPVNHVALGVMHNWIEGVLQHHWRIRWGFEKVQESNIQKRKYSEIEEANWETDSEEEEDDDGWIADFDLKHGSSSTLFTEKEKLTIQESILQIKIPLGITPVPNDVGNASSGKLKASEWQSLYIYIIPLVIMDLLVLDVDNLPSNSTRDLILDNICCLVQCTLNIISSKHVTEENCAEFSKLYNCYNLLSSGIFNNKKVLQNHHYALHIPDQMLYWGPLNGIAEWGGERLIGVLQKVKTNGQKGSMDQTILRKACELQRVLVEQGLGESLESKESNASGRRGMCIELTEEVYSGILSAYRAKSSGEIRNYRDLPHPPDAQICPGTAKVLSKCVGKNKVLVTVLKPNNVVMYKEDGVRVYGMVQQIYEMNAPDGKVDVWVQLKEMNNAFQKPSNFKTPSLRFRRYLSRMILVVGAFSIPELTYIGGLQRTTFAELLRQIKTQVGTCKSMAFPEPHLHVLFQPHTHISTTRTNTIEPMGRFSERKACIAVLETALQQKITTIALDDLLFGDVESSDDKDDNDSSDEEDDDMNEIDDLMIILQAALSHRYYAPRIALQQAPPITEFLLVRLEDRRFKQEFRMTRASFLKLCARVADDPVFQNNSNNPQRPITEQMMVTLKRLGCFGNGTSVGMLARFFRVGEGTVELYTDRCIMAILRFKNQVLKWPTAIERGKMAEEYGEVGFKGCVGVIDGSLIPLSDSPSLNSADFYSRKGFYCISTLIVCDSQRNIQYIYTGWPGCTPRLSGDVKFKHNSEARLVLFTWTIYTRRLSVHTNLECGASIQEASSWTVDQRTTYFQFLSCSASGGDRAMHWWSQGKISKPKRPAPPDQRAQGSNSCECVDNGMSTFVFQ